MAHHVSGGVDCVGQQGPLQACVESMHGRGSALGKENEKGVRAMQRVELEGLASKGGDVWAVGVVSNVVRSRATEATRAFALEPPGSAPAIEHGTDAGGHYFGRDVVGDFVEVLDEMGGMCLVLVKVSDEIVDVGAGMPVFKPRPNFPVDGVLVVSGEELEGGALKVAAEGACL